MKGFESNWNIGIMQYETGDYEGMVNSFSKYINEENPTKSWLAEAYYFLGLGEFNLEHYSLAIKNFTLAIENHASHNYFFAFFNRALSYAELGQNNLAIDDFTKAIQIDSENIDCYINRAELYGDLGFRHDAIDDLKSALKIDQRNIQVLEKIIFTYMKMEKYEDAIYYINEIIFANPKANKMNFYNRGNCYMLLKKYPEAINDFDKAIEIDNTSAHFYFSRGLCNYHLKSPKVFDDWKIASDKGHEQAKKYLIQLSEKK